MLLNATALLAVIGLLIALLWAWVWSGVFASSRRVAMRMDMRGGSASAELNRVVWPLMPLLSLVWFVTADLVGHPGWMARRYYVAKPGARERELGAGAVI